MASTYNLPTKEKKDIQQVEKGAIKHSFLLEEQSAFVEHVNSCLGNDAYLKEHAYVPLRPDSDDLYKATADGILLWCVGGSNAPAVVIEHRVGGAARTSRLRQRIATVCLIVCCNERVEIRYLRVPRPALLAPRSKLINLAAHDTIDERALNFPVKGRALNMWEMTENQNVAINSAKSIGCQVVNIGAKDLISCAADHREYLLLGLVWQIVKVQLMAGVSIKENPEIVSGGSVSVPALASEKQWRLLLGSTHEPSSSAESSYVRGL